MPDFLPYIYDHLGFISKFGNNILFLTITFVVFIFYLHRKKPLHTIILFLLTTTSYLYSVFLKGIFKMPRPFGYYQDNFSFLDMYSLPSSHVVFYTVFWGYLFYLTFNYDKKSKLLTHILRWLSAYYIITVGASRILLGYHFLIDVIFGYIFGLVFLFGLILLDKKLSKTISKNQKKDN